MIVVYTKNIKEMSQKCHISSFDQIIIFEYLSLKIWLNTLPKKVWKGLGNMSFTKTNVNESSLYSYIFVATL